MLGEGGVIRENVTNTIQDTGDMGAAETFPERHTRTHTHRVHRRTHQPGPPLFPASAHSQQHLSGQPQAPPHSGGRPCLLACCPKSASPSTWCPGLSSCSLAIQATGLAHNSHQEKGPPALSLQPSPLCPPPRPLQPQQGPLTIRPEFSAPPLSGQPNSYPTGFISSSGSPTHSFLTPSPHPQ